VRNFPRSTMSVYIVYVVYLPSQRMRPSYACTKKGVKGAVPPHHPGWKLFFLSPVIWRTRRHFVYKSNELTWKLLSSKMSSLAWQQPPIGLKDVSVLSEATSRHQQVPGTSVSRRRHRRKLFFKKRARE